MRIFLAFLIFTFVFYLDVINCLGVARFGNFISIHLFPTFEKQYTTLFSFKIPSVISMKLCKYDLLFKTILREKNLCAFIYLFTKLFCCN